MNRPTTLERAFALARSGTCTGIDDIRRALKKERYDQVDGHLAGASIGKQLKELCKAASEAEPAPQATIPPQAC